MSNDRAQDTKADRLRSFSKLLKERSWEQPVLASEWQKLTEQNELTPDDLFQLELMAQGHLKRALSFSQKKEWEGFVEEARSASLLQPRDVDLLTDLTSAFSSFGNSPMITKERATFEKRLKLLTGKKTSRKTGKSNKKKGAPFFVWVWAAILVAIVSAVATWGYLNWIKPLLDAGSTPITNDYIDKSRDLPLTLDTQGVPSQTQLLKARLLSFPEAHVIELSAWITFPKTQILEWKGTLSILAPDKRELFTREMVLHADDAGPLSPGQGVELFQQVDAQKWFQSANEIFFKTTAIKTKETQAVIHKEFAVQGIETLTNGYNLKVSLVNQEWKTHFAKRIDSMNFELENSGLKPFQELVFDVSWRGSDGKILKTKTLRPVSPFRAELPPGGKMALQVDGEFSTEVFTWQEGQDPYPIVTLKQWQ